MATNIIPSDVRLKTYRTCLSCALGGTGGGAALTGAYGGLVAGLHFVSTGHWDQGPTFAAWALLVGAVFGLAGGIALGFSSLREPDRIR